MIKKILLATFLLYAVPMALYEGSTYYLESQGRCVGDVCMKSECPDGDSVDLGEIGILMCEDYQEFADTRNMELLR